MTVGTLSDSATRRKEFKGLIAEIDKKYKGMCGCRRIAAELGECNHAVSVGLVAKLMHELGFAR